MKEERCLGVRHLPEVPALAVIKRVQWKVQDGPATERCGATEKIGHHRECRTAHDDRHTTLPVSTEGAPGDIVDEGLDHRVELGALSPQVRVLVKDQQLGCLPLAQNADGRSEGRVPAVERDGGCRRIERSDGCREPAQGRGSGLLQRQVVHAANRVHQSPQKEAIPETAATVNESETQPGALGRHETNQVRPFDITVVESGWASVRHLELHY